MRAHLRNLKHTYSRYRFAFLFYSILVTVGVAPVLSQMGVSTRFFEVFLGLNILTAVLVTVLDLRSHAVFALLVLLAAARIAYYYLSYDPLLTTSHGLSALVCLISCGVLMRFMLGEGKVDSERIFAALSGYLMIGVVCGLLFFIFEKQWPGSMSSHIASVGGNRKLELEQSMYFSFVTLGTLGYGDILPGNAAARSLAVTEALVGQMYLVVVVARLVSLYEGRSSRQGRSG
jgi:hypothetical protein